MNIKHKIMIYLMIFFKEFKKTKTIEMQQHLKDK